MFSVDYYDKSWMHMDCIRGLVAMVVTTLIDIVCAKRRLVTLAGKMLIIHADKNLSATPMWISRICLPPRGTPTGQSTHSNKTGLHGGTEWDDG